MVKTKLVATVGPACSSDEMIGRFIDAGVNVFRLNFSHGTLDDHQASLDRIRRMATRRQAMIAVLGDLCGPKIRLGRIAGGRCELQPGREITFQRQPTEGTPQRLWCRYPALIDDVEVGHRVLIDDGSILLRATRKQADELICECEIGGTISDHKGINLPDSKVSAPSLTDKDLADLDWVIRHELDLVALSFVRRPDDLRRLREVLDSHGSRIRTIAKIEKPEALDHLDAIIQLADGVMVARGDLGVEMDLARVPIVQKEIALHCQRSGKPVIIATQMLQSMINSPVPTRAEVSDVANAILDRADAVMLSGETAVGRYPVEAATHIRRIAEQTERFTNRFGDELGTNRGANVPVASAILRGTSVVAADLEPPVVAVWTLSGQTAILLSKHRLAAPIVALAADEGICRQLAFCYGVIPIFLPRADDFQAQLRQLDELLVRRGLARTEDQILIVGDTHPDIPGETDTLLIHVVGSSTETTAAPRGA
ncbi:MAG TPA: pyruvate kinase [Phycisphaerae bacterium]|nr:pyruvate kinase [Phycisphaerae bacterium]